MPACLRTMKRFKKKREKRKRWQLIFGALSIFLFFTYLIFYVYTIVRDYIKFKNAFKRNITAV